MAFDDVARIDWLVLVILIFAGLRGAYFGGVRETVTLGIFGALAVFVALISEFALGRVERIARTDPANASIILAVGVFVIGAAFAWFFLVRSRSGDESGEPELAGRIVGIFIGCIEGAILAVVIIMMHVHVLGRRDPILRGSASLAAVDAIYEIADDAFGPLPKSLSPHTEGVGSSGWMRGARRH